MKGSRNRLRRPLRFLALPFVQENPYLAKDHVALLHEGFTLREMLRVRIDRKAGRARLEACWQKPAPEMGPRAKRTVSHVFMIDLRTLRR